MEVDNEKDLGKAIDNKEETIKVRGDLCPKIKKIWYMDKFLWCLCLGCLAVAIAALAAAPTTGGLTAAVTMVAGTPAAMFMGAPTAVTAVLMAASGSGAATLKQMRCKYRLEEISGECIILHRK